MFSAPQSDPGPSGSKGFQFRPPKPTSLDVVFLLTLGIVALGLRWYRLDLISFRYDAAEALFRARETFSLGRPPLTGIENSLGFRNPGGFIWTILPAALLSPRVELATGWVGLITVTALWPIYRMGRILLPGLAWVLPCAAYVAAPWAVFAGRNVWAQNLMPVFGAWALWTLLLARDDSRPPRRRSIAAVVSIAILGFATSVHLSGAAYLIAAMLLLMSPLRKGLLSKGSVFGVSTVLVISGALLIPALFDRQHAMAHPKVKPEHIVKYEAQMPPPPPLLSRVRAGLAGQFGLLSSMDATSGIERQLSPPLTRAASLVDFSLLLLTLAGLTGCALGLRTGTIQVAVTSEMPYDTRRSTAAAGRAVLVWLGLPALLGALFVSHLNATYFAPAFPAVLLLAGAGACFLRNTRAIDQLSLLAAGLLLVVYSWLFFAGMSAIDRSRFVEGIYYIPLADQERVAWRARQAGVPQGHLYHLSGLWFQHSYDYLHKEVAGTPTDDGGTGPWLVMDDLLLRRRFPLRHEWLEEHLPHSLGTVRYRVVTTRTDAERLANAFYAVPMQQQPESDVTGDND